MAKREEPIEYRKVQRFTFSELKAFEGRIDSYRDEKGNVDLEKMYFEEGATNKKGAVIIKESDMFEPPRYQVVMDMFDIVCNGWHKKKTAQDHEIDHHEELAKAF